MRQPTRLDDECSLCVHTGCVLRKRFPGATAPRYAAARCPVAFQPNNKHKKPTSRKQNKEQCVCWSARMYGHTVPTRDLRDLAAQRSRPVHSGISSSGLQGSGASQKAQTLCCRLDAGYVERTRPPASELEAIVLPRNSANRNETSSRRRQSSARAIARASEVVRWWSLCGKKGLFGRADLEPGPSSPGGKKRDRKTERERAKERELTVVPTAVNRRLAPAASSSSSSIPVHAGSRGADRQ